MALYTASGALLLQRFCTPIPSSAIDVSTARNRPSPSPPLTVPVLTVRPGGHGGLTTSTQIAGKRSSTVGIWAWRPGSHLPLLPPLSNPFSHTAANVRSLDAEESKHHSWVDSTYTAMVSQQQMGSPTSWWTTCTTWWWWWTQEAQGSRQRSGSWNTTSTPPASPSSSPRRHTLLRHSDSYKTRGKSLLAGSHGSTFIECYHSVVVVNPHLDAVFTAYCSQRCTDIITISCRVKEDIVCNLYSYWMIINMSNYVFVCIGVIHTSYV